MKRKRADSLSRLSQLQAKMRDLGRWRLTALEQERAQLSDDLMSVFAALEAGELAYGRQAALSARRARALQKRIDELEGQSERARRKAETHAIRAKLAESAAEAAAKAHRQERERKELAELIERTVVRRGASQG